MPLFWIALAALWGVAEATFFFIVPDVLLTFIAVRFGLRRALALSLVTAIFAAAGGTILWRWSAHDAAAARAAMLGVPFVGPDLLAKARAGMAAADWPLNLVIASLTGTPYKLYAVEAGMAGVDPYLFAALSIPARLIRFVITASLAAGGNALFARWGAARWRYVALALAWIAIYATYWALRVA